MTREFTEEHRKKLSLARMGKKPVHTLQFKEKMHKVMLGNKNGHGNLGNHIQTNDALKVWRENGGVNWNEGMKGVIKASEETKKKMSKSHEGHPTPEETRKKIRLSNLGQKRSLETKKRISDSKRGIKLTKEHIRKSLRRRLMSSLEVRVNDVIQKYKLPYKFVGNGKFFIERKNPDFVNVNGEKKLVEVYCRKHKDFFAGGTEKWKEERLKIFEKYGWETIFIEDWQTNKEETIVNLLMKGGHSN